MSFGYFSTEVLFVLNIVSSYMLRMKFRRKIIKTTTTKNTLKADNPGKQYRVTTVKLMK